MATNEKIILDPSEVSTSRTALDITDWIEQEGANWGDATIETFLATRDRGAVPVDYTVPNRPVEIPLRFSQTTGGTTVAQARANIQAKVALMQKEGGWLKRITNSGGTVYADIVDAATVGFSSVAGWESGQNADVNPSLTLECLPDFYQDEVTLSDHTETTAAELVFTETGIQGDYPARVRVVVDDDQAQDQRGLAWAFRSRYYSSASTAALKYEAESLGPLDTAAKAALSGASGGTVVTHGTLATNWTPVLSTNLAGTQYLTHQGTYRMRARVYSTSGTTVRARLVWDVGDMVNPVENEAWRLPAGTAFYSHDFGEVRLDAPPVGTYRWQGVIQARGDAGAENFSVDKLWLEPVDEGWGVLTAPTPTTQGLVTYSARDEFNQTAGATTGKTLPVGGAWTVVTNSDTDDFNMDATNHTVTRTTVSDTGTGSGVFSGRGISAGASNYTGITVAVDAQTTATPNSGLSSAVFARLTDSSNYLAAAIIPAFSSAGLGTSFPAYLWVYKVKAGVTTVPGVAAATLYTGFWYTITLGVGTNGTWTATFAIKASSASSFLTLATLSGSDTDLATGGTLATGKVGFADQNTSAVASTRTYDNFSALPSAADAVTFASRSTQLTTDGHYRLDSGGTAYGPVGMQTGDLPRLPVAGLEGRTTEVYLKPSRGDFDQIPDFHSSTDYGDDVSARITYRPCYLNVGTI